MTFPPKITSLFFLLSLATSSFAWNATGHQVIAEIAYQRLQPAVREKVDKLVTELSQEYPAINTFPLMATWADTLHGENVDTFKRWHYIDTAFSADGTPLKNLVSSDNAIWAIQQIKPIIGNDRTNNYERARFLAFLVHITGDLHQPLHTVSRISANHPDGDLGGNDFAVKYKVHHTKIKDLHSLWDYGAGVFGTKNPEAIHQLTQEITAHYPEATFANQINDLNPEDWAQEGMKLATTVIYNTPENVKPSDNYLALAQQTSEQEVALAGYRLAIMLNQLLQ